VHLPRNRNNPARRREKYAVSREKFLRGKFWPPAGSDPGRSSSVRRAQGERVNRQMAMDLPTLVHHSIEYRGDHFAGSGPRNGKGSETVSRFCIGDQQWAGLNLPGAVPYAGGVAIGGQKCGPGREGRRRIGRRTRPTASQQATPGFEMILRSELKLGERNRRLLVDANENRLAGGACAHRVVDQRDAFVMPPNESLLGGDSLKGDLGFRPRLASHEKQREAEQRQGFHSPFGTRGNFGKMGTMR